MKSTSSISEIDTSIKSINRLRADDLWYWERRICAAVLDDPFAPEPVVELAMILAYTLQRHAEAADDGGDDA